MGVRGIGLHGLNLVTSSASMPGTSADLGILGSQNRTGFLQPGRHSDGQGPLQASTY